MFLGHWRHQEFLDPSRSRYFNIFGRLPPNNSGFPGQAPPPDDLKLVILGAKSFWCSVFHHFFGIWIAIRRFQSSKMGKRDKKLSQRLRRPEDSLVTLSGFLSHFRDLEMLWALYIIEFRNPLSTRYNFILKFLYLEEFSYFASLVKLEIWPFCVKFWKKKIRL